MTARIEAPGDLEPGMLLQLPPSRLRTRPGGQIEVLILGDHRRGGSHLVPCALVRTPGRRGERWVSTTYLLGSEVLA